MKQYLPLVVRTFMGAIFIMAGAGKVMNPGGTMGYMASAGMPLTGLFFVLTIIVELGGGLSILFGFKTRYAALLIFFFIPVTLIFHTNFGEQRQMILFMKNITIMGGLLALSELDSGTMSIDHLIKSQAKSADQ